MTETTRDALAEDALAVTPVAGCGCGAHGADGRRAVAVGPDAKARNLKHCAATAIRAGEAEADATYDELVELRYRHSR